jgi:hypothetical protein
VRCVTSCVDSGGVCGAVSFRSLKYIELVIDAGSAVAAFTARPELKVYLRRRLDVFVNPLVYTFADGRAPTIMTMSRAPADG